MMTPATLTLVLPTAEDAPDGMLKQLEAFSHPVPDPAPLPPADAVPARAERRSARRRPVADAAQDLRISLPDAAEARAVDVSSTGVLTETTQRLCPGRTVDLFLRLNGTRRVLRARVVRSTVYAVSPRPIFRAALQFEDACRLPECDE